MKPTVLNIYYNGKKCLLSKKNLLFGFAKVPNLIVLSYHP